MLPTALHLPPIDQQIRGRAFAMAARPVSRDFRQAWGKQNAPVAQLDRASAYGAEGWGFKSLLAHWFQRCSRQW